MDEQQRIETWISLLEHKARQLLDGLELDAEEMTPKARVDSAVKLLTLIQKYITLQRQSATDNRGVLKRKRGVTNSSFSARGKAYANSVLKESLVNLARESK